MNEDIERNQVQVDKNAENPEDKILLKEKTNIKELYETGIINLKNELLNLSNQKKEINDNYLYYKLLFFERQILHDVFNVDYE